ncbi:hypothetical protein RJT34_12696 [Clitoria ternatea]|uniref:Uncharacterized protein n=1 Tax=Clitoria ternatea TaxID=43366 RepID=A0AAN9PJJ7_CLITE
MPSYQGIRDNLLPFFLPSSHQEVMGELPQFFLPPSHHGVSSEMSQLVLPPSLQEVTGELPQFFLHHEELMASTLRATNIANTNRHEVESFVKNTLEEAEVEHPTSSQETDPMIQNLLDSFWMFEQDLDELLDKSTLRESSGNIKINLSASEEGNSDVNGFVHSPTLKQDSNKSETSDCSSSFQKVAIGADASRELHILRKHEIELDREVVK